MKLKDANLTGANLRDATLQDTDLREVKGLIEPQLGGTDLLRAKLPEDVAKFEALGTVEELSKNAGLDPQEPSRGLAAADGPGHFSVRAAPEPALAGLHA